MQHFPISLSKSHVASTPIFLLSGSCNSLVPLEALVAGVFFIVVVLRRGLLIIWQRLEHSCEDRIDRFLVGPVAVPDHNEVGVETDAYGDAADVIAWKGLR